MTERSLTPSPHRSQNLERGVFSSLSALSLYKQSIEERKQIQSSSSTLINRKSPIPKPRSPNRVRPLVKRIEKSPDPQPRSPLKVQNRVREEQDLKSEQDFIKLQETVRSLKVHLDREKKTNLKLDNELKELKLQVKTEIEKSEKLQKTIQNLLNSNNLLTQENGKLVDEVHKYKDLQEGLKEHLKNLASIMVSILSSFFAGFEEESGLVGQEKLRVVGKIKDLVAEKFEDIQQSANVDLTRAIGEVRSWLLATNFPRQVKKKEEPEISYTIEYFNETGSLGGTKEYLSQGAFGNTIKEELSFNQETKTAIALYDFEGEREGDLAFFCGDTIDILEECESGWWIGTLHGKTGSFPYNFVQII